MSIVLAIECDICLNAWISNEVLGDSPEDDVEFAKENGWKFDAETGNAICPSCRDYRDSHPEITI